MVLKGRFSIKDSTLTYIFAYTWEYICISYNTSTVTKDILDIIVIIELHIYTSE